MANFKRKRCRRSVRCTLCTADRWRGNSKDRFAVKNSRIVLKKDQKEQEE
jgi:hypothetical protein